MELLSLTLLILAAYVLHYYFKKRLAYFEDLGIPYVPAWPLLGNMAAPLFQREHLSETIKKLYNYHPEAKYVGIFDFVKPVIMVRDPELIKSIGVKNHEHFPDHLAFIDDKIDRLFGGNIFNLRGERWKDTRSLLTPAFTSSKIKAMYELIVESVHNFINHLDNIPESERRMVDSKDLFAKLSTDTIATCAFGVTIDSLKNPKNEFYVLGRDAANLEKLTMKFFLSRAFPAIMKLFKIPIINKKVATFFENLVRTMVKAREENKIVRPDLIQLMMDARSKSKENVQWDFTEMTSHAFSFFFAGYDSTSTQMCIIAHELAINPKIQKRLQDEIDEVLVRTKGKPTYEDIQGMLYLDAIFFESLRRHTHMAVFDRLCTRAFELPPSLPGGKPFIVQPGTDIWIPAAAIHQDPNYYDNPQVFDPDRYYNKKVGLSDPMNLGFGIGPRGCLGNRFAVIETKTVFFYILSKFNLRPNEKTSSPMKYSKKTYPVSAEGGFWLTVEKRK